MLLHYLVKYKTCKIHHYLVNMNKSLELNFWPILYDSIVFLCLQTQSKTKHNLTFRMGQKFSSKLSFIYSPNTDGFYKFIFYKVV